MAVPFPLLQPSHVPPERVSTPELPPLTPFYLPTTFRHWCVVVSLGSSMSLARRRVSHPLHKPCYVGCATAERVAVCKAIRRTENLRPSRSTWVPDFDVGLPQMGLVDPVSLTPLASMEPSFKVRCCFDAVASAALKLMVPSSRVLEEC
jgi:hypothetical protein